MPFGLFEHRFTRSPFANAVPLTGTDKVAGLDQLERLARQRRSVRTRYKRFQGPYLEYTSLEDLRRGPRNWQEFWNCDPRDMGLSSYSVPGSLDALAERTEENVTYFLPNYLRLMACIILIMLGIVNAMFAVLLLGVYAYTYEARSSAQPINRDGQLAQNSSKQSANVPLVWKQVAQWFAEVVVPVTVFWLLFLTPVAVRVARGFLLSLLAVGFHAGLHRSPSELKHRRQPGIVRWMQRKSDIPEGLPLLWRDVWQWLCDRLTDLHYQWQWKMLALRDQIAYHWTLRKAERRA